MASCAAWAAGAIARAAALSAATAAACRVVQGGSQQQPRARNGSQDRGSRSRCSSPSRGASLLIEPLNLPPLQRPFIRHRHPAPSPNRAPAAAQGCTVHLLLLLLRPDDDGPGGSAASRLLSGAAHPLQGGLAEAAGGCDGSHSAELECQMCQTWCQRSSEGGLAHSTCIRERKTDSGLKICSPPPSPGPEPFTQFFLPCVKGSGPGARQQQGTGLG